MDLVNQILNFAKLSQISANNSAAVTGLPPRFSLTGWYPTIITGFGSKNAVLIERMAYTLDMAIFFTSNGKYNFTQLHNENFNYQPGDTGGQPLQNLMGVSKLMFQYIMNNGAAYSKPLSLQEIDARTSPIKNSTYLNSLPSTNPIGPLASKIQGNLKTVVTNILNQIN